MSSAVWLVCDMLFSGVVGGGVRLRSFWARANLQLVDGGVSPSRLVAFPPWSLKERDPADATETPWPSLITVEFQSLAVAAFLSLPELTSVISLLLILTII